ncbi:FG-GAP-like repeat-containing protein [Synechococcus sp. UW140]|uniref:beta strand repeat-containing protein n=1 Tax=Synechococcus sp. UW140 TaxID=368503 RepID=UPI0031382FD4
MSSFAPQTTFATGNGASSVTLGDVDGDGLLDIITANQGSNNASVLLGNGDGAFKAQATFATGTKPRTVTLGDVNGDGRLDIITANRDSNNISVLLGNGNGTFQTQSTFATGTSPRSVTLGDVNGDGRLDIITANRNSYNTSVLLGNGDGTFQTQQTFAAGSQPQSGTLGDVNGDGKLDIITANFTSNNASVLLGNGNGTFQTQATFATGINPRYVTMGDVNADGKLDIVIANTSSANCSVLLGNGNGTFQTQATFAIGNLPSSVTLGDLNGDGKLDIITSNEGSDDSNVLLGNGNGTFQTKVDFAMGDGAVSVTLGDVNGDGRLDIIAANYNSNNASVILGTGGSAMFATFSPQQTFAAGNGAQSQALGDLNGDGKLDMVTANGGDSSASVLLGNGNGTFKDQTTVATGTSPRSVTLGDVNDDGRLDIITANRDSSTASVLLGNGNGTFQTQTTFATGGSPRSVSLGDVNGDGRLDIITANNNDNNASLLLGNGNGTFQTQATFAAGSSPRAVAMGDVDGDGKLDIITANNGDASASVLLGNANGTFKSKADFATGSNPRALTLGDLNGDGNLDIITANFVGNSVSVLLGNGNGTFQTQATFATNRPYSVSLGDLNGDGNLDIIAANYSSDTASVLLGNGNGTFAAEVAFAAGDGPLSVALGDLNGDGRLDITTANFNSGNASVLLNSLAFTGQTATVDTSAPAAPTITSITDDAAPSTGTIAPGGFTNDTSLDLTGTAEAASTVSIYNGSTLLGTTTADNTTGAWSYSTTGLLGGSTYVFNATATDAAGNISPASSPNYSVTVDTAAPAAPTITSITDNAAPSTGSIAPGGSTNDTSLDLTGTAEAASTVSIYNGSTLLGTTTADNTTGAWSYSATGLSGGNTYVFKATATDAAGNISPASSPNYSVTVDTTAPAAPSITSITDDAEPITGTIAHGGFTNDTSLDLTGTAEAASTVSIYNGSTLLGTTTADTTTGAWSYSATGLANGSTYAFNATATDATGNVSNASSPQQTFTTETGPFSVALGDVNGDGELDIITANFGSNSTSVLLGNGNGTFQTQATFATGRSPRSVTLGDVNGDGTLDIVTANSNFISPNASVLLGNGNGTFQTQATFSTGLGPNSVALGDINGDGRLDIITANRDSNTASVLLGNGNGTFQTQATFSTGLGPNSVALGDVNGDGTLDIITANLGSTTVSVLLGNGNGTFQGQQTFATGANPFSVSMGDVNGDGRLDIITANNNDNNASVLLGNGNGTFGPKTDISTGTGSNPASVTLGDVNGDGRLDIITANAYSANVSVLLGNGNGSFQEKQTLTTDAKPVSVALGDMNGDGRLDIITANLYSANVSVLLDSLAFTGQRVTVDTAAPAAPTITSITDDAAPITGTIAHGGFTNDTSLDLTGSAEAASTVSIYNGSELLGTTTANNTTGAWSYSTTGLLGGSTYVFKATATDAAGNISAASSPNYSVTVDTVLTSGPIDISTDTDTGEDDTITAVGLPVVTFTGESNLVLRLIGADGTPPLSQGTQYDVSYTSGTYTVTFLDAAPQTTGRQPFGTFSNNTPTGNGAGISDGTYTIEATDSAGNAATISSIMIATNGLDNDGAVDTFEQDYDLNNDGVKDSQQRFVATFESSTQSVGATKGNPSSITINPIEQSSAVDPLTGGSLNALTSLIFRGLADTAETTTGDSITGLQTYILNNPGNQNLPAGAELVVAVTDQPRFRVVPEIVRTGTFDPTAEASYRDVVNKRFKNTIQQVDLYYGDSTSAWNALFKPDGNGGYYFFGYNPTTGLGGILLDRDNNGTVDGARLFLKDNALGDLNPDDYVIDDPVGMAALAQSPTLRLSDDNLGLVVDGVAGTGLWLNIAALSAAASWQNGLELRTTAGEFLGAVGATANSGNLGSKQIYLEAGKELRFAQNSGNNGLNTNPLLMLSADAGGFRLRLDDAGGPDRDYNDLELRITSSLVATKIDEIAMARRQMSSADAIIDLTTIPTSGAKLTLSILTDCGYINRLGLVKVADTITGYQVAGVAAANTDAFRQAVRDNLINPGGSAIYAGGLTSRTITWDLTTADAGLYAAVLINPNGEVFTFGSSTASDGRQHVKLLGDNTFGFEDLLASQGSDWDFNDSKIKVSVV